MEITREYFANYKYLESMIKSIRRRLRYFENHPLQASHGVVKGSMERFPYAECHFVVDGPSVKTDEERNKLVNQLTLDLSGNLVLYEDMKLEIEAFIEGTELLNLEERTIFRLKYVDGMKDREIGDELGYDRSTITKKIDDVMNRMLVPCYKNEISSVPKQLSHNSHF